MQLPIQTHTTLLAAEWEADATPGDLMRIAQAADRSGYLYVAVCDHVAIPSDKATAMSLWWQDTLTTLGYLAAGTERVGLLSHVYVLAYRHPLVAAKGFATLDHLSGGRAIVGVGTGHVEGEFDALGVPLGAVTSPTRSSRCWPARSSTPTSGTWVRCLDRCVPRPPIWIGGSGLRRAVPGGP
jgi:alkanesulfonate monooxygenase SsuD/methylene tetrahydromethanopterin reductase-like flavin-dependent oxidoreductase (luciferase family)